MSEGQIVRVRYMARAYLAVIVRSGQRSVAVRFMSTVPAIGGRRRSTRSFRLAELQPYGKGGVDFEVKIKAGR